MTWAPAGTVTDAPTAAIFPSWITTVPFAIQTSAGVDEAGIDEEALAVDDLGAGGDGDRRPDGGDLSVLDHDGAVRDPGAGDGGERGVGDREDGRTERRNGGRCWLRREGSRQRAANECREESPVHGAPSLVVLARGRRLSCSIRFSRVGALSR